VTVEIARLTKRLITHVTFEWFLSRVDSQVTVEIARLTKRLITHATFEWFLSRVDSQVTVEIARLTKRLVTHVTFEWFLSAVNSAVSHKAFSPCKSFPTNSTFKRFLSWMTSPVSCQVITTLTTFATFCALIFTSMNIHMLTQAARRWKTFLAMSTWIHVFSSVSLSVNIQVSFRCKPFVTHCTSKLYCFCTPCMKQIHDTYVSNKKISMLLILQASNSLSLVLSSCGYLMVSMLSALVLILDELSPIYYVQH